MRLEIPEWLCDEWMTNSMEGMPKFQRENRVNRGEILHIDFSRCEWANPLPLLAIATEIACFSRSGRTIELDLGIGTGQSDAAKRSMRARLFLNTQGFLSALTSRMPDVKVKVQFDAEDSTNQYDGKGTWFTETSQQNLCARVTRALGNTNETLLFGDQVVIPATLIELPLAAKELSIRQRSIINRIMEKADVALYKFNTRDRRARDTTLQRLNQTILELVSNSSEHAYGPARTAERKCYVGIYARLTPQPTSPEGRYALHTAASHRKSPFLMQALRGGENSLLELYVVDVGEGLLAKAHLWKSATVGNPRGKHTLRVHARGLFVHPFSSHDRESASVKHERGSATGLMHLHQVWSHANDWSRLVVGTEWMCAPHPRPSGWKNGEFAGGHLEQRGYFSGTALHVVLTPSSPPDLGKRTGWFDSTYPESDDVCRAVAVRLSNEMPVTSFKNQVVDIRRTEALATVREDTKQRASVSRSTFVRVHRVAEKNLTLQIVESWLNEVTKVKSAPSSLYLCDLGRYQAIDTEWVLTSSFNASCPDKFFDPSALDVFVVTEDLCLARFGVFQDASGLQLTLRSVPVSETEVVASLHAVLVELRKCDSEKFWRRISDLTKTQTETPILVPDVLWSSSPKQVLPFYVNFAIVIQDNEISRHLRRSLRRMLALFAGARDEVLDQLAISPLHDAKKWLTFSRMNRDDVIFVGSTSVSGNTLRRARPLAAGTNAALAVIDLLQSPYIERPADDLLYLPALLWDPKMPVDTKNAPKFRRVGETPHVQPVDFSFDHGRIHSQRNIYVDAEPNRLLKFGHWAYDDRHSLIELNAELAIDQSGASETGLVIWLSDQIRELRLVHDVAIAFPMHRLSQRLVHSVLKRLDPQETVPSFPTKSAKRPAPKSEAVKLLALTFFGRVAGGLSLLTPLSMQHASAIASAPMSVTGRTRVALIVDTAFITNRTQRHIARQLRQAGFLDIRTTGIVNRSSYPTLINEIRSLGSGPGAFETYWHWPVPILGSSHHCMLCGGLASLMRLRPAVSETRRALLAPLDTVLQNWRAVGAADFWIESGIASQQIRREIAERLDAIPPTSSIAVLPTRTTMSLCGTAIEHLRAGAPLSAIRPYLEILLSADPVIALATIGPISAMATPGLSDADHVSLIRALIVAVIDSDTHQSSDTDARSRSHWLGLSTLIFASLQPHKKLAVLNFLIAKLQVRIVSSHEVCLALTCLVDHTSTSSIVQREFDRLVREQRGSSIGPEESECLQGNYEQIRLAHASAPKTWRMLEELVGSAENHEPNSELGKLRALISEDASPGELDGKLLTVSKLLMQCNADFLRSSFGTDLSALLATVDKIGRAVRSQTLHGGQLENAVESSLGLFAKLVYASLVRCGATQDSAESMICASFTPILIAASKAAGIDGAIEIDDASSILEWPPAMRGYLPLCMDLTKLFTSICLNFKKWGAPTSRTNDIGYVRVRDAWVSFEVDAAHSAVYVVFRNAIKEGVKAVSTDKTKRPFLDDLGYSIVGRCVQSSFGEEYDTRIRIPTLDAILEAV